MGKTARVWGTLLFILLASSAFAETLAPAHGGASINADPSDYQSKVNALQPGDTLVLAAGDYTDLLNIRLHGTENAWITIKGPDSGPKPRFLGHPSVCCNTIEIREASYVALENLEIDGQGIDGIFAISAAGSDTHHIRIENCTIRGHSAHQQTVGISTKTPTWDWVVRGNTIVDAGTGMYFGNSDGAHAFVGGLIENNLFLNTKGYNMQIKHQNQRAPVPGMPTGPRRTIIRHNVFIKGELPNEDGARPNLLVGPFPDSGPGSGDWYEIYGNVFFHNHRESLLQATGRVIVHDNIFMDCRVGGVGDAVYFTNHHGSVKHAYVYNNTFFDVDRAVYFDNGATEGHAVVGNLMFVRNTGIGGSYSNASDNIVDTVANAAAYVNSPSLVWGQMDFYPLAGQVEGTALDLSAFSGHTEYDLDFNADSKGARTFRGAYAGDGANPGWQLDDALKEFGSSPPPPPPPADTTPPNGATVVIEGGAATTADLTVDLVLSASDAGSGMGAGAQMRFSNDGATWSPAEPFATTKTGWELFAYGGSLDEGMKTVYARFADAAGNWTSAQIAAQIEYQAGGGAPAPKTGGGSMGLLGLALLAIPAAFRRR